MIFTIVKSLATQHYIKNTSKLGMHEQNALSHLHSDITLFACQKTVQCAVHSVLSH